MTGKARLSPKTSHCASTRRTRAGAKKKTNELRNVERIGPLNKPKSLESDAVAGKDAGIPIPNLLFDVLGVCVHAEPS